MYVLATALTTLFSAILVKKFLPKIPNLLVGLVAGSVVAILLGGLENDIKLVGEIPGHLR